eukprot:6186477-Pleurochrysis_carterae.AAC.6
MALAFACRRKCVAQHSRVNMTSCSHLSTCTCRCSSSRFISAILKREVPCTSRRALLSQLASYVHSAACSLADCGRQTGRCRSFPGRNCKRRLTTRARDFVSKHGYGYSKRYQRLSQRMCIKQASAYLDLSLAYRKK